MGDKEELRERKYPRVKESCRVAYRVVKDRAQMASQEGLAVNISGGGMCFSSDEAVEPGSMITVQMSLEQLATPVVSLGRVVWCEPAKEGDTFDVGVEFWWIGWADVEAQGRMLKYINQRLDELGLDETDEAP